jgi:hypothetical protein
MFQQKVTQNVAISLGYFIFSKNHNEPPKVAQFTKIAQSGPNVIKQFAELNYSSKWDFSLGRVHFQTFIVIKILC